MTLSDLPASFAEGVPAAFTVSVALCTYNGARYIDAQIRSICEQTLAPVEIVLSDDASSDDVVERAVHAHGQVQQSLGEAAAPRLRVLRNSVALGVRANFEQAMMACEGNWIALCDQDDIWRADKLQLLTRHAAGGRAALLLHSDARLVGADGASLGIRLFERLQVSAAELAAIHGGGAFEVLLRRNLVTGATAMLHRSLLSHALPIPDGWLHDEWLGLVAAALQGIDVIEETLIDYRQHGANQVGASRLGWRDKIRKALAERGDDPVRRCAKTEALIARLQLLPECCAAGCAELARDKLEHQARRAALPSGRLRRVLPILRELTTGRYRRLDYGYQSVLRDLLESA